MIAVAVIRNIVLNGGDFILPYDRILSGAGWQRQDSVFSFA